MVECAILKVQLTSSAQEMNQLRALVSKLESELGSHPELSSSTPRSSATLVAELVSLREQLQLREQEVSELRLHLQAANNAFAEVTLNSALLLDSAMQPVEVDMHDYSSCMLCPILCTLAIHCWRCRRT